jgi:hypothetical protein
MFSEKLSKLPRTEILVLGIVGGMLLQKGIHRLLEIRTENQIARLHAINPELGKMREDFALQRVRSKAKSFVPNVKV